jgi:hypothetical protein
VACGRTYALHRLTLRPEFQDSGRPLRAWPVAARRSSHPPFPPRLSPTGRPEALAPGQPCAATLHAPAPQVQAAAKPRYAWSKMAFGLPIRRLGGPPLPPCGHSDHGFAPRWGLSGDTQARWCTAWLWSQRSAATRGILVALRNQRIGALPAEGMSYRTVSYFAQVRMSESSRPQSLRGKRTLTFWRAAERR